MEKCPKLIDGIQCKQFFKKKQEYIYCVGNIEKDKYFFLKEDVIEPCAEALAKMNGEQTLDEIEEEVRKKGYTFFNIQSLYTLCLKSGFIENEKICSNEKDFNEFESLFKTIWTLKLNTVNSLITKINKTIWRACLIFMCFCILGTSIVAIYQFPELSISMQRIGTDFRAVLYFVLASAISVMLHEMSHNIVAVNCGLRPPDIKVAAFAYMTLCFYIKIPGIYFLDPLKRIYVWGAGAFSNLFLMSVSYIGVIITNNQLQLFWMGMLLCNFSLIIAAITPFYLSDGYFVLSTLCKAPNLRKNAWKNLALLFKRRTLESGQIYYILYFIITFIVTVGFLLMFCYSIGVGIITKYHQGLPFVTIAKDYLNLFRVLGLVIISRVISKVVHKFSTKKGVDENCGTSM